ncbi:hypothetical protein ACFJGW_20690 [Burkholderiaceae bacterium UC74_6]
MAFAFLDGYLTPGEACRDHPWLDCILSGVLALQTAGDTATRSLSRRVLFNILQHCEVISTRAVAELLRGRYAGRTVERYASAARVASKAIERRLESGVPISTAGSLEARRELDAPYQASLEAAEAGPMALCLAA